MTKIQNILRCYATGMGIKAIASAFDTLLRQNATDFVLNGHFGTVTLRPEAFAMGKAKA